MDDKKSDENKNDSLVNIKKYEWSEDEQRSITGNIIRHYERRIAHPKTQETALKHVYKLLNGLPVPTINKVINKESFIKEILSEPENEPCLLKSSESKQYFKWAEKVEYEELEQLFKNHYYTTDKHIVTYSKEFIEWALSGEDVIIVGIRQIKDNELVGVLCGRSTGVNTETAVFNAIELVFFVIHQRVRKKGLATYLVREMYRQARVLGYSCGIYTSNSILPKPYAQSQLLVRYLNVEKLYEIEYFKMEEKQSISEKIKTLKLRDKIETIGLRKMTINDVDEVQKLFSKQCLFSIYPEFTKEEFKRRFLDHPKVIRSYIVEKITENKKLSPTNPTTNVSLSEELLSTEPLLTSSLPNSFTDSLLTSSSANSLTENLLPNKEITDFISFFTYEYTLLPPYNKYYEKLKVAMIYYSVFSTNQPITRLVEDILIKCKRMNIDIVTIYNSMENNVMLFETGFESTGELRFYNLVNWQIPNLKSTQVGFATIE
jgi:GNAT superfamily N-acetyltransferase